MFIAKYSANGAVQWAKKAGGIDYEESNSIAVDTSGNTYVAGKYSGSSITFGSTTLSNTMAGSSDVFLAKYNVNGNVIWAKSAGGQTSDDAASVAVDPSGNIFMTGNFSSTSISFGSDTLTNTSVGHTDIFLTKYDTSGNVFWAKSVGGTNDEEANSIAVDASENAYLAGDFYSATLTFGITTLTNIGSPDIFIAKLAECNLAQPIITSNRPTTFCFGDSIILNSSSANAYLWSNSVTTQSDTISTAGNYSVTVSDLYGCKNADTITVTVGYPYANEIICEVNVDTVIGKNLIVWEKTPNVGIVSYIIYKEGIVGGVYNPVDTIPYDSMSVYRDMSSNAMVKSDRYKISVIDTCGNESAQSPAHKTLHLTVNLGMGGAINLIWENYEGFSFGSYYIYRGPTTHTLQPIDTIPNTITTYTDPSPPLGINYYLIVIAKTDSCIASSSFKDQTETYNTSVSNMEEYQILGVEETSTISGFTVYPNPAKNILYIENISNDAVLNVYDYCGKLVMNGVATKTLDISKLSPGVYCLKVTDKNKVGVKRFVKE